MLHQLIGIVVVIVSAGVFISRYGVPTAGLAFVYLLFGSVFVAVGVVMGQMLETSLLSLLLLERWHFNLSLMAIGYSALAAGFVGLAKAVRDIFSTSGDKQ